MLKSDTGEKISQEIVGKYIMSSEIKNNIDSKLRKLDYITFDDNDKLGIIIHDFHVEEINRIIFTDKITKILVKKTLEQFPKSRLKLLIDDDGGIRQSDGILVGIVRENKLKTIMFVNRDYVNTSSLRVDKIISIDDL